jgi:DDE superfamily endonuclease/Tc5 transposase DNA-binding domain
MPRKYKRKSNRASWTQQDLTGAKYSVENLGYSLRKAASFHGVPVSTLRDRLKKQCFEKKTMGSSCYLGDHVETQLAEHIVKLQEAGFAPTRQIVKEMAYTLANKLSLPMKFNPTKEAAGDHWFLSFMERNQNLSLRKSHGLSLDRAQGLNKDEVVEYFDLLENKLREHDLFHRPHNIYNMDESGLQLTNAPCTVVAKKGSIVHNITSAETSGESVTIVACTNAVGEFKIPPYCIFKGVNFNAKVLNGAPEGTVAKFSPQSHFMTAVLFKDWLENHFFPHKPAGTTLLLLDGHSSHMQPETLQFAADNDIVILCLPSHTTHCLQPLDKSFFKPLKGAWNDVTNNWMRIHKKKLTRNNFGEVLKPAWDRVTSKSSNGSNGFKRCGIYPFDRNAIPAEMFIELGIEDSAESLDIIDASQSPMCDYSFNSSMKHTPTTPTIMPPPTTPLKSPPPSTLTPTMPLKTSPSKTPVQLTVTPTTPLKMLPSKTQAPTTMPQTTPLKTPSPPASPLPATPPTIKPLPITTPPITAPSVMMPPISPSPPSTVTITTKIETIKTSLAATSSMETIDDDVNTICTNHDTKVKVLATDILQNMHPVPQITQKKPSKRKQHAACLTDAEFIQNKKTKQQEKLEKLEMKENKKIERENKKKIAEEKKKEALFKAIQKTEKRLADLQKKKDKK